MSSRSGRWCSSRSRRALPPRTRCPARGERYPSRPVPVVHADQPVLGQPFQDAGKNSFGGLRRPSGPQRTRWHGQRAGGTGATPRPHSCPSFGCENATSPSDEQCTARRRRASARRPPDTTHTCLRWARAAGVFFRSDFRGALFTARKNKQVRGSSSDSHACKPTGAPENYSEPAVLASDCVSDS